MAFAILDCGSTLCGQRKEYVVWQSVLDSDQRNAGVKFLCLTAWLTDYIDSSILNYFEENLYR